MELCNHPIGCVYMDLKRYAHRQGTDGYLTRVMSRSGIKTVGNQDEVSLRGAPGSGGYEGTLLV